jgi:hypothetical protein
MRRSNEAASFSDEIVDQLAGKFRRQDASLADTFVQWIE